jgi:hypothetical protein
MFKHSHIQTAAVGLLLVVGLMGLSACSGDSAEDALFGAGHPDNGAPELPAMSTMTMDLSYFGVDGTSLEQARAMNGDMMLANAGDHSNFINALVRVLYIQLTLWDTLEEPVGAFALAIHSIPQPQADGSYLWTYIFVEDGNEFSIFLYGKEDVDHVDWRLEVSTNIPEFPLDHFVWFDGESRIDETGGYWQFYKPVFGGEVAASTGSNTPGEPVVRMDWENAGSEERLTVLVNEIGGEDEGDMLMFRSNPNTGSIEYYDADLGEEQSIVWYADGTGSLTVVDYNGGEPACWDAQQVNTTCP